MSHVTLFKRGNVWWIYYRIHGVRVRKSLATSQEKVAKRKAKIYEQKLLNHEMEGYRGRTKLQVFWEEYGPHLKQNKRPKTVDNEIRIWTRFSDWLEKKKIVYLDQITKEQFKLYRLFLLENQLKKSSVNLIHRHLSAILSFAVEEGYIESNPLKKVKKYKVHIDPPRYLTKGEIEKILSCAEKQSQSMHIVFALGIYAGFRRSEIANARWEWFDLEHGVIVIQAYKNFIPKNHRCRPIPMHENLKKILLQYQRKEGFLLNSHVPEEERKNLIRIDFKNGFKTVRKKAGLEWVTPHTLRHTFASQLAKAGVSLYKIQQWLGHSDPRTTMIYAHLQVQDEEINLI